MAGRAAAAGRDGAVHSLALRSTICSRRWRSALPVFAAVPEIAPPASFRMVGQRIPRQPARYSGRTAISANVDVHEAPPPPDPDTPLAFSMEGYPNQPPAALIPRFWAPGWNSVQSVNKFQNEVGGPLRGGDPGRRLLEPPAAGKAAYFTQIPPAFVPREDEWYVLPAYHLFRLGGIEPAYPRHRQPRTTSLPGHQQRRIWHVCTSPKAGWRC